MWVQRRQGDRSRVREKMGQHPCPSFSSPHGAPSSTILQLKRVALELCQPHIKYSKMSVIITVIIIITPEACFPLLFLIGGEDSVVPNFLLCRNIFLPLLHILGKGKKPTKTNKHKTGTN